MCANSNHFYFDYKNGKYGYNTDPNRGADTFTPFSSGEVYVYTEYMQGSQEINLRYDSDHLKIVISSSSAITTKPVFNGVTGNWESTDINLNAYSYEKNYENVKTTDRFNLSIDKYGYRLLFIQY